MRPANPRTSALSLLLLLTALPACKPEEADETQGTLTTSDTDGDSDGTPTTSDTDGEPLRTDLFSEGCARLFGCDCDEYRYADAAQCEQVHAVQYAGLAGIADAAGLMVDEACLKQQDISVDVGCKTVSEFLEEGPSDPGTCTDCRVVHGTVAVGQPCVDYGKINDCAQGLACEDKICVDPCQPRMLGEPCNIYGGCVEGLFCNFEDYLCSKIPNAGEPCSSVCAEGFTCVISPGEDSVCVALAGEGQACEYGECVEGLHCDFESGTCKPPSGPGETCNYDECTEGLVCNYDQNTNMSTCGPPPKIGEPCQGPCEDGASCDYESGVCFALPGVGEECPEYNCADGLMCDDSRVCVPEQPLICGSY